MKKDVALNDSELQERATALATTCEEITRIKLEQKEAHADFKERLDALERERARLARIVRTRLEERDVEGPLLRLGREAS